jgi:HSP20 family molecular chaperone IbpA
MRDDERPRGFVRALLELLAELEEADDRTRRGQRSSGRTDVDYSLSVGTLGSPPDRPDRQPSDDRPTPHEDRPTPHVTTTWRDDEFVVVADLPRVDEDDIVVDIDRDGRSLAVGVDGGPVERVPLDDTDWTIRDHSFNNGVLEVRLADG